MPDTTAEFTSPTGEPTKQQATQVQLDYVMTANMLIGALVGSACAYATFAQAPGFSSPFTVSLGAVAGAAVGATCGMLVGGLIDIVARRRLDAR